jgi:hypothetical protein
MSLGRVEKRALGPPVCLYKPREGEKRAGVEENTVT